MPQDSDNYEFTVEHGDIIALATDGIIDNVYDSVMAKEIGNLQNGPDTPNTDRLQVILSLLADFSYYFAQNSACNVSRIPCSCPFLTRNVK